MSNTYEGGVFSVNALGATVTTAATTANVAIPNDSSGNLPKYIRVAATTESYVRLGIAGVTATTAALLVQPADSVILAVGGRSYIAYIQGTSAGKVNITPLENC